MCGVVGERPDKAWRWAGVRAFGPDRSVPFPGVTGVDRRTVGVDAGSSSEENGDVSRGVEGHYVYCAGPESGVGFERPGAAVPFPGVVVGDDAAADNGSPAGEDDGSGGWTACHAVVASWGGSADCEFGPSGAVPGPGFGVEAGLGDRVGVLVAPEEEGDAADGVVDHFVSLAGGGASDDSLGPRRSVPFPGFTVDSVAGDPTEEDGDVPRGVVGHGVPVAT